MTRERPGAPSRARMQSQRHRKRMLAVRAMAGETAWLEGRLKWQGDHVVWDDGARLFTPSPAALALAQRRLNQIGGYRVAAQRTLGDVDAWLAQRRRQLDLAKRLHALGRSDVYTLAAQARESDHNAAHQLVQLLLVEALCLHDLPVLPSYVLAECGPEVGVHLQSLLADESVPEISRALSALVLGVIHGKKRSASNPTALISQPTGWCQRAYEWGIRRGLPDEPALISALLADHDGVMWARRCLHALGTRHPLQLSVTALRELLMHGSTVANVVAVVETLASTEALTRRVLRYRDQIVVRKNHQRRPRAQQLRQEREQFLAQLAVLLHTYIRNTPQVVVVNAFVQLMHALLELNEWTPKLADAIIVVLRRGLELPPELQCPYLELLQEHRLQYVERATSPTLPDATDPTPSFIEQWPHEARDLLQLLQATEDVQLVRQALQQNLYKLLSESRLHDRDFYYWLIQVALELDFSNNSWLIYSLRRVLQHFPSARTARATFQPLIQAMHAVPPYQRGHVLDAMLDEVPETRAGLQPALLRLQPYAAQLAAFAQADQGTWCICHVLVAGILVLEAAIPDQAHTWFDWLLTYLSDPAKRTERDYEDVAALRFGISLGAAVADGELERFQRVVQGATQRRLGQEGKQLQRGIDALARFPLLRASIALLLPQQPNRCVDVLLKLALVRRLGQDVVDQLAAQLSAIPELVGIDAQWQAVCDALPESESVVACYLDAQRVVGGSLAVPAGVRRALAQPAKLSAELAHLERLIPTLPERTDLAARCASLCLQLADRARLEATSQREAVERLRQITAEAQLKAAEHQVQACFRDRLARVAGPLPADLQLDADLLNATLLTVDLRTNRRLLLRLIRAHLAGTTSWREQHHANAAFLRGLEKRGVDVGIWLSELPRVYQSAAMVGGRVRLHLERNPIRILQMGNYFDTCLSFGGVNAFSTVTNACELNKRVVYATDGAGRVVGRKLIGINADGRLVGFRTYTALHDEQSSAALRGIMRHYLLRFAEKCGLELADEGKVPTLFATDWYDDGVVPWSEESPAASSSASHSRHRRVTS